MKHFVLGFFLLIGCFTVQAQIKSADTTGASVSLVANAQKMMQLFINKDYANYISFIHPKIIKLAGGKDKLLAAVKTSMADMQTQGLSFKNVTQGTPNPIIVTNNELQSVVTQIFELKTAGGRVVSTSYLIATSVNKGKSWLFSDTSGKNLKQMKAMFPTLSNKLVIPEKTKPVFYKD